MGSRENKLDVEKAANIVRDAGGKVVGRTRLQKIAFLLEVAGLGEGFEFEYRHYGPYSEQLASAIAMATMVGIVREEERLTNWGGTYSIFTATSNTAREVAAARAQILGHASNADPVALELAATAAFLALDGESDPWSETARRKPEKADRLDQAKSLYFDIERVPTPNPLPAISERTFKAC